MRTNFLFDKNFKKIKIKKNINFRCQDNILNQNDLAEELDGIVAFAVDPQKCLLELLLLIFFVAYGPSIFFYF